MGESAAPSPDPNVRPGMPGHCPSPPPDGIGDDDFVSHWEGLCAEAEEKGAVAVLQEEVPQLRFPVRLGIAETLEYKRALVGDTGLFGGGKHTEIEPFPEGSSLTLKLHDTGAGRIPVVTVTPRDSFLRIIHSMCHQNAPSPVAPSMGSLMVTRRSRGDRFLVLTGGDYSGSDASVLDVLEADWERVSGEIRLAHESCHYVVQRLFPDIRFALQDELVADATALMDVFGKFEAAAFSHFMGLERWPSYRRGGRLEHYAGPLIRASTSDELIAASKTVEHYLTRLGKAGWQAKRIPVLTAMTYLSLQALGADDGSAQLEQLVEKLS